MAPGRNPQLVVKILAETAELIKNLNAGRGAIETYGPSIAKMQETWKRHSAEIIQQAALVTAGLKDINVSTLTAADSARALRQLEAGMAQLQAQGQPIPPLMAATADSLRKVSTSASGLSAVQEHLSTQMTSAVGRVRDMALGYVSGEAALRAFSAAGRFAIDFLKDSISEALAAETAQRKLTAALQQQGLATPQVLKQFDQLATQFARTTVHSDGLIKEMQGLLVTVGGVLPSQMGSALQASADLAAMMGGDLRGATMLVAKAFEDNFVSLKKMGVQIDDARAKAEGMSYVLGQVQAKFGGQAQAEIETYAGQILQLENAYNDLKEALGQALIDTGALDVGLLAARLGIILLKEQVNEFNAVMSVAFDPSKWAKHGGLLEAVAAEITRLNAEMVIASQRPQIKPVASHLTAQEAEILRLRQLDKDRNELLKRQAKALDDAAKAQEAYNKAVKAGADHLSGADVQGQMAQLADEVTRVGGAQKIHAAVLPEVVKRMLDWSAAGHRLTPELQRILFASGGVATEVLRAGGAFKEAGGESDKALRPLSEIRAEFNKLVAPLKTIHEFSKLPPPPQLFSDERREEMRKAAAQLREVGDMLDLVGAHSSGALKEVASFATTGARLMEEYKTAMAAAQTQTEKTAAATALLSGGAASFFSFGFSMVSGWLAQNEILKQEMIATLAAIEEFGVEAISQADAIREAMERGEQGGRKYGARIQALRDQLAQLKKEQAALNEAMGRAGLTLEDAGTAAEQLARQTSRLISDYTILSGKGFTLAQITRGNASALNDLIATALTTGQKIPAALAPMVEQLARSGGLTEELRRKLLGLPDAVDWKTMAADAEKFGISLDAAGKGFQQARLTEQAEELVGVWDRWELAGADMHGVMVGLQDEVNALLKNAQDFGLKLPGAMKPMLEAMAKAGLLTDAAGNKLDDLSGFEFDPTLEESIEDLVLALKDLVEVLKDLPKEAQNAVNGANQAFGGWKPPRWNPDAEGPPSDETPQGRPNFGGIAFAARPGGAVTIQYITNNIGPSEIVMDHQKVGRIALLAGAKQARQMGLTKV